MVYAILFANGVVKIGTTRNIESRIKIIQTHSASQILRYVHIETNYPRAMETELHKMFKDKRLYGEFFGLSKDDWVTLIKFWEQEEWAEKSGFYKDIFSLYDEAEMHKQGNKP